MKCHQRLLVSNLSFVSLILFSTFYLLRDQLHLIYHHPLSLLASSYFSSYSLHLVLPWTLHLTCHLLLLYLPLRQLNSFCSVPGLPFAFTIISSFAFVTISCSRKQRGHHYRRFHHYFHFYLYLNQIPSLFYHLLAHHLLICFASQLPWSLQVHFLLPCPYLELCSSASFLHLSWLCQTVCLLTKIHRPWILHSDYYLLTPLPPSLISPGHLLSVSVSLTLP